MQIRVYIIAAILCGWLSACTSNGGKQHQIKQAEKTANSHPELSHKGFGAYLATISEIKLPYRFAFENIVADAKRPILALSKLQADHGNYYEPDADAAYAQLPGTYQGAAAYPLLRYKINDKLTAVAYTFQKTSSSAAYYPFVELLIFDAEGKIKGRQVIANGRMDAEHTENTTFTIVAPTQVNTVNNIYEYADSSRTGEPLNHLEDKQSFHIQSDGKITSNKSL